MILGQFHPYTDKTIAEAVMAHINRAMVMPDKGVLVEIKKGPVEGFDSLQAYHDGWGIDLGKTIDQYKTTVDKVQTAANDFEDGWKAAMASIPTPVKRQRKTSKAS